MCNSSYLPAKSIKSGYELTSIGDIMNICIIGCGSIGRRLARALENMDEVENIHFIERKKEKVEALAEEIAKVKYADDFEDILEKCQLVVETASQGAVKEYVPKALEKGKDVVVMSIGAFVDDDLREKCKLLAKQNNCKIYFPSGAICGIDGLSAASTEEIEEVILISYKSPKALKDLKYFAKQGIKLGDIKKPKVVYEGFARDAVQHFPKNVNVAATIAIAGLGFERTRVKIIVDPKATRNTHRLIVKSKSGEIESWTTNLPFPENPRTSYLAALSVISAVKKIIGNVWVGA